MVYVLIAAVVLVWGMVGYSFYSRLTTGDDTTTASPVKIGKETFNDYSLPKDTVKLLLNYRDPFGQVVQKDTVMPKKSQMISQVKRSAIAAPFNWDFIKYLGYLKNPASKKLIAFLTINGKDVTLADGETMDNVRLLKNLRDSVKISFNGKVKYIPLHARTP